MASTDIFQEAEQWIRDIYLPKEYGQSFREKKLLLQSRGEARFAAVSDDGEVVVMICTRPGYTPKGKVDEEALMKVRSDALKILWLETTPAKRFMVLSDPDMVRVIKQEKKRGRFPREMEIIRVKLPSALEEQILQARKIAPEGGPPPANE